MHGRAFDFYFILFYIDGRRTEVRTSNPEAMEVTRWTLVLLGFVLLASGLLVSAEEGKLLIIFFSSSF